MEGLLGVPELIEGVLRQTPGATGEVATESVNELPVFGYEVARIDPVAIGSFKCIGEPGDHEEGRIALPIDEARHR